MRCYEKKWQVLSNIEIRIGKENETCEIPIHIDLGWAAFGAMLYLFQDTDTDLLKEKRFQPMYTDDNKIWFWIYNTG